MRILSKKKCTCYFCRVTALNCRMFFLYCYNVYIYFLLDTDKPVSRTENLIANTIIVSLKNFVLKASMKDEG